MSNWWFNCAQSRYDSMMPEDDTMICVVKNELWLDTDTMMLIDDNGHHWNITLDDYEAYPNMFDLLTNEVKADILEELYENGVFVL